MASVIVEQVCWRDGAEWVPAYFCEPFCGSCAVSFAMPEVSAHIVNDLHGDLVNAARVLAHPRGVELVERLSRTLTCEAMYREAVDLMESVRQLHSIWIDQGGLPVNFDTAYHDYADWAWAFLVASWMGPNGQIGLVDAGVRFAKRWGPGGGDPATRMRSFVSSLDDLLPRLRRFTILNEDAMGVLAKVQDTDKTALYIDPPYLDATRTSGRYLHDFSDAGGPTMFGERDDHERLAEALCRFEHARIVLSYEDHPRLDELYPGWSKVVIDQHKNTGNTSGSSARVREVLLVNGEVRA
jgi:DNA adenine methylase